MTAIIIILLPAAGLALAEILDDDVLHEHQRAVVVELDTEAIRRAHAADADVSVIHLRQRHDLADGETDVDGKRGLVVDVGGGVEARLLAVGERSGEPVPAVLLLADPTDRTQGICCEHFGNLLFVVRYNRPTHYMMRKSAIPTNLTYLSKNKGAQNIYEY